MKTEGRRADLQAGTASGDGRADLQAGTASGDGRAVWGWALYDFANSAFATTVLSVVFNVYFARRIVPPEGVSVLGAQVPGASLWSYAVSASMLITFLMAPVLGTLADHSGRKKLFLTRFWLMGCAAAAGLFFMGPGDVWPAAALFIVANVGFAGANIFYNAFLPFLAPPARLGRLSGFGWAVGYAGGGLCLALNLAMIRAPQTFGLSPEGDLPVRATLLCVAVWWFVFGLPLQFWLREAPPAGAQEPGRWTAVAARRLAATWREVRLHRNLWKFLAAYLVYNDGIETIIVVSALFGAQALGMEQGELILCFLMIQGVALAGALLAGRLADRFRHKPVIFATLAAYTGVILWAYRMEAKSEFWVLGVVVGLVLGGSQAASRSLMALLTPAAKSAEFFSFFGLVGKLTAVLGPLVFGLAAQFWGLRNGVLSLLVFFAGGAALLCFVSEGEPLSSAKPAPSRTS
jgi:MFS transporter, UMF1 family